jgi:hypothetical protein
MEKRKMTKIEYVKPEILDLGPVTQAVGGTCVGDGPLPTGKLACAGPGNYVSRCVDFGDTAGST